MGNAVAPAWLLFRTFCEIVFKNPAIRTKFPRIESGSKSCGVKTAMSQTSPFPPVGPNKPFPGKPVPVPPSDVSGGGMGRACGCFLVGCGGIMAIFMALCGFGYYWAFYTSWPLQLVKNEFEESGVKIEGLRGNLTSGVEMDSIEIPSDLKVKVKTGNVSEEVSTTYNSKLKDLKLKYSSGGMFGSGPLVIDEASIGSGTIYVPMSSSPDAEVNVNTNVLDDLSEAMSEVQSEFENAAIGRSSGEIQIRKIVVKDLTLIDPNAKFEYKIDEISYRDFVFGGGAVSNLGDLRIKTDNLEVETTEGGITGTSLRGRHMSGRLKPGKDEYVLKEIPFEFDYEINPNGWPVLQGDLFDKQIEVKSPDRSQPLEVTFNNFEPDSFIKVRRPAVHPSQLNLKVKISKTLTALEPDGSFAIGRTVFNQVRLGRTVAEEKSGESNKADERKTKEANWIEGTQTVDGKVITVRLYLTSQFPMSFARLYREGSQETAEDLRELWASVAYGKPFAELSVDEQDRVTHSVDQQLLKASADDEKADGDKLEAEEKQEDASSKDGKSKNDEPSEKASDPISESNQEDDK
jgi:hypothetical protein